jgi:hypothetical protein
VRPAKDFVGRSVSQAFVTVLTECDLQAVISLPSGVFAALIFEKHRSHGTHASYVWFYDLAAGRYRPVTSTAVIHDAPADILGDVLKVENEILQRGTALLKQLGDQP